MSYSFTCSEGKLLGYETLRHRTTDGRKETMCKLSDSFDQQPKLDMKVFKFLKQHGTPEVVNLLSKLELSHIE